MAAETIIQSELFQKCLAFHGHLCPGLSFGYQAAVAGMDWLSANRSEDEEIVAVVETDACCSDAIQVITGCTFGKGNFIYHDYGKMAFTFFSRDTGKGVRIARRNDPEAVPGGRHAELLGKVMKGNASAEEYADFRNLHEAKSMEILDKAPEDLFTITSVTVPIPPKAHMAPSLACSLCGEPTMATKLVKTNGQSLCRGCLDASAAAS
jgi:formylmethanofuran dehydrogenase subunit E